MSDLPLDGVVVAELGARIAVGAAGSLLAQLGATVVLVEPAAPTGAHKWAQRPLVAADKYSLVASPSEIARLLQRADLVLTSSDVDSAAPPDGDAILCDITAFGRDGPLAGQAASDAALQALCAVTDTTGAADGPPVTIGVPILEMSGALYAVAAALAALRARAAGGPRQTVEVALYDVAVNALTTFLPSWWGGRNPSRIGNWHNLLGPWNAYRAANGWVLICTASEPQWQRLCGLLGRADLAREPRFDAVAKRILHRPELDVAIEAWTGTISVEDCIRAVSAVGIPCGPILCIADLAAEPNLAHRRMVREIDGVRLPGSPFRTDAWSGRAATRIPHPDTDRAAVTALLAAGPPPRGATTNTALPLAGIRVVEVGQYTTAPLAARYLYGLGAEVVRVEPPGGEPSRRWLPSQDGMSYFFAMFNGGKRAVALDLAAESGRQALAALLRDADILLENLKPGALARLGFDAARLTALNPRLISCAISGFGIDSAYPERPAFDSVVQAMSGLMDVTRGAGVPFKAGISVADIGGGQFALVAILAALRLRERTGRGQAIDLSMQDAAAWLTQAVWNGSAAPAEQAGDALTVAEIAQHPQTLARGLIYQQRDRAGHDWFMLGAPMRLSATPLRQPPPAEALLDWSAVAAQLSDAAE